MAFDSPTSGRTFEYIIATAVEGCEALVQKQALDPGCSTGRDIGEGEGVEYLKLLAAEKKAWVAQQN
jgi:hypothetical protein